MLVRCVYDSLAMKYRYAVEQLQNITGKKFNVFYALGESAADDLLCQTMADVGDGRRIIRKSEKQIMYHPQNSNLYNEKYQQFCDILHIPSPML